MTELLFKLHFSSNRHHFRHIFLLLLLVFLGLSGNAQTYAATEHCGNVTTDETWTSSESVHIIACDVIVAHGVTLTMAENVIVKFDLDTNLIVYGVLNVQGTNSNPVYLTSIRDDTVGGDTNGDGGSTLPAPSDWTRIEFSDISDDTNSVISHAIIRYGGQYTPDYGAITLLGAAPTIENTSFVDNAYCAIRADLSAFPSLAGNSYLGFPGNGVCLDGGTVSGDVSWDVTDTPYFIRGDISIDFSASVSIGPGVVIKMGHQRSILVNGTLRVLGTAAQPVYITSFRDDTVGGDTNGDGSASLPAAGNWGRIQFNNDSEDTASLIQYAIIRYGGQDNRAPGETDYGAVTLMDASPTIRYALLTENAYAAMLTSSSTPALICNDIANNSFGVYNATPDIAVMAEGHWWGDPSGPVHASNLAGNGDGVSDGVDFSPWAKQSCLDIPLPEVDLTLTSFDQPDPVVAGGELLYSIIVANSGTSMATGVVLTNTLSSDVSLISATSPQASCAVAGNEVTCNLDDMGPNSSIGVAISVKINSQGSAMISHRAGVFSTEEDPNMANNMIVEETIVRARLLLPMLLVGSG